MPEESIRTRQILIDDVELAKRAFELLQLTVVDFDMVCAAKAAELRPPTRKMGLSLGDRSCLALSMIQNATAITADRDWKKLTFCPIEVIR